MPKRSRWKQSTPSCPTPRPTTPHLPSSGPWCPPAPSPQARSPPPAPPLTPLPSQVSPISLLPQPSGAVPGLFPPPTREVGVHLLHCPTPVTTQHLSCSHRFPELQHACGHVCLDHLRAAPNHPVTLRLPGAPLAVHAQVGPMCCPPQSTSTPPLLYHPIPGRPCPLHLLTTPSCSFLTATQTWVMPLSPASASTHPCLEFPSAWLPTPSPSPPWPQVTCCFPLHRPHGHSHHPHVAVGDTLPCAFQKAGIASGLPAPSTSRAKREGMNE